MKSLCALCLCVVIFLAGCDGQAADPYQQIQIAQANIAATQRAQVEQRKQAAREAAQATEAAMATQGAVQAEIDLMLAQAQGTQTALELEGQRLEAALASGQATRAAGDYMLAATATQQAVQATATAMGIEMEHARRTAEREEGMARLMGWGKIAGMGVLLVGLMALLVVGVWYLWKLQDWTITWRDRKNLIYHSPDGTIFMDYSSGEARALLVRELSFFRDRPKLRSGNGDAQEVTWITPSVVMSGHRNGATRNNGGNDQGIGMGRPYGEEEDGGYEAAVEVVERAIRYYSSGEALSIPRYNVLDMSAERWKEGVDYLKGRELADNQPGKKTITYECLDVVMYRLQHSPTP